MVARLLGLGAMVTCAVMFSLQFGQAANSQPILTGQRGEGLPYEIPGTQVFDLPDAKRGIPYQIYVSLPKSYGQNPARRYPVVYVTDADYGFPMLRLIGRRMNNEREQLDEFIVVGLAYASGQDSMASRRRDYTPTANGPSTAPAGALHGESLKYRDYLRDMVLPFVDGKWRTDPERRVLVGHSYGGLLAAQILLTEPDLFSGYLLGSPSFWFDKQFMLRQAPDMLARLQHMDAAVYMYVGEFEALKKGDRRYQQEVDLVADNKSFAHFLQEKGYAGLRVKSEVLLGEDHMSVAPRGFTQGLLFLLPGSGR